MEIYVLCFGLAVATLLCVAFINSEMDEEENPDLDI